MTEGENQQPQPLQKSRISWLVRLLTMFVTMVIVAGLVGGGYCIGRGTSPCDCSSCYQQGVEDGYVDGYLDAKNKYDTNSTPSDYQAYSVRPGYFTVSIDSPFTATSSLDAVVSNKSSADHVYVLKLVDAKESRTWQGAEYAPSSASWFTITKESAVVPAFDSGMLSAEVKITPLVPSGYYWGALKVFCLDAKDTLSIEYQLNVFIVVHGRSSTAEVA